MGDERYPRTNSPQGDYYGRNGEPDYSQDYGSGRSNTYSSARSYQAAGELGDERGDEGRRGHGQRDQGDQRYGQREVQNQGRDYYGGRNYAQDDRGQRAGRSGGQDYGRNDSDRYGQGRDPYQGSYASDGRRFENAGRHRDAGDDARRYGGQGRGQNYGHQPQGYDDQERGFFDRAGDEVRSWFGDEEAERRREMDARQDERSYRDRDAGAGSQSRNRGPNRDHDYHSWRDRQLADFDRDYDEYRRENQDRFHAEFSAWRSQRQGQRDSLNKVEEHMEVVGMDGEHVGIVDKVRGDRILLTKNDQEAGGRHHSIPSRWIQTVDTRVTLGKTAQQAKDHWRDEERNQATFGDDPTTGGNNAEGTRDNAGDALSRSLSGTSTK